MREGTGSGEQAGAAVVRASDAAREQAAEAIRSGYADGRLARDEFEQRLAAAYGARTRGELHDLTADLPAATGQPPQPAAGPDPCLLCLLLCTCPPVGVVYWLVNARRAWAVTGG